MAATVLCVDNDRSFCQILSRALTGEGYRVVTAYDGEAAVASLAEDPPDLVLLDLILPRRDGFSVLEAIRRLDDPVAQIPVVLMTGCSPSREYERRADELGALALLSKPVPLERLLELVARGAGEKPQPPEAKAGRSVAVSGSLDRLYFPHVLHHLHGLRASGVLHLESGRKRKWIQLRDGYPVAVRSNLVNECLGNFLLRSGRVSREQVAESRRGMRGGRRQGEILVAMRILSEPELSEALRAQGEEKLFEIFTWTSGSFRFENGGRLQRANAIGVGRSPANLILHGIRNRFPEERIDGYLRSHARCHLAPAESPFYRFQEIELEPDHANLLYALDGTRRLGEFLDGDGDLQRTLYALIATGLLELREGDPEGVQRVVSGRAIPQPVGEAPRSRPEHVRPADEALRAELSRTAEAMESQSHFEVLGIEEGADEAHVREAYARVSERTHPDRYAAAGEAATQLARQVFARVEEAHATLVDPRRRAQYLLDRRREQREAAAQEEGRRVLQAERHFQTGDLALRQRDFQKALLHFGRALELYSEEGEYHAHYGYALHLCHPEEPPILGEALEHVKRGVKLASDREKPYLFMGRLYKAADRVDAAEKMFTRAVQIQPECVEALRELRLINMRREKSKGLLRRLLRF